MNETQNYENNYINDNLKEELNKVPKLETTIDKIPKNFLIESEEDLSRIPMVVNDLTNEKEELLKDIECFEEDQKKQLNKTKLINRKKRKRANSKFYNRRQFDKSTTRELMHYSVKKRNISNINSPFELEYCYRKMNKMISKYSFAKISEIILKMNNNIEIEEDFHENEIYKKIKKVTSIIKKKEDIILMLLRILSSKNLKSISDNDNHTNDDNKEDVDNKKNSDSRKKGIKENRIKQEQNEEEVGEAKELSEENKEESNDIDNIKKGFIFKEHYHNDGNNIFCYGPKKLFLTTHRITLYCQSNRRCKAKCTVYTNSNFIKFSGSHIHNGIPLENFYKVYPFLRNQEWQDIQVIFENGKDVLKRQS